MIHKNFPFSKIFTILFPLFFVILFTNDAMSQCTYCSCSTTYTDEWIGEVAIGTIDNVTTITNWSGTVADYTSKSTDLKSGQSYTIKVVNGGNVYAQDYVKVFFDWNHDCDLTDSGEDFTVSSSDGGKNFSGTVLVPTTALPGATRMRVRMMYNTTVVPCGSTSYGEVEDYTANVIVPAPDAGVAQIIPPTSPYNEGTYPVSMVLGSYGDGDLGSCTINWSVNGISQTPYNWSGTLKKGNTTQILLGNYSFTYPTGGPYNPFNIRVWLTNIVGVGTSNPDTDPSNNDKNINTSPSTEDAQPTAISQPSGAFIPGSVPIWVTLKNNARKPLTTIDIEWYIDGVKQGTKKWFGNLGQNQTEDVNVGSYNFTFKTPLAPFLIEAHTVNPNGVSDPITTNDWVSRSVAPSLVAGTYLVGGTGAHFPTLANAINYLNASGILGDGDVYMKINTGTYNEQVMLTSFPHGNCHFYFESVSGFASDVKLNFSPTSTNNYIFGVNGVSNVTFRNLTFNVTDGGAGTAMMLNNINNLTLDNLVFNGVANGATNNYSILNMTDATAIALTNSNFYNGYNAIYAMFNGTTPSITMNKDNFQDYANYAVTFNGSPIIPQVNTKTGNNDIQAGALIDIENCTFKGSSIYPQGGVSLNGPAIVKNNTFTNFSSTNAGMCAINIAAQSTTTGSVITGNSISNMAGVWGISLATNNSNISNNAVSVSSNTSVTSNGMYLMGNNNTVSYNKVNATGNTTKSVIGIYAYSCGGTIANNLSVATTGISFQSEAGNSLFTAYNTLIAASSSLPAAKFIGGTNFFSRNIVVNNGTGNSVINLGSSIQSANNILYTKGSTNATDLTAWKTSTGDNSSSNAAITLTDDGTYQFALFIPETLTYFPLGLPGTLETYDYYNNQRAGYYYAGYAGIILEFSIIQQPEPLLACAGDVNKALYVAAAISYGAEAQYQWQKDGIDIPGATKPIYKIANFTYETTGNYRVRVYGPANTAEGLYTDEVLVYTLRPTEITKQPKDQQAMLGGTVFLDVEVHIKGMVAPYFQHKYQWWRHYNGEDIQLMDNEHYANTTSPIMTITNLKDLHFSQDDFDYYYCVIEGQCGVVISDHAQLKMSAGEIMFDIQPTTQNVCIASNLVLTASATIVGSTETLDYQWYFNGNPLSDDARTSGTKTSLLTISSVGPDDEGTYYCEASSSIYNKVKNSDNALVALDYAPTVDIQPLDQNLKEGDNLTLAVVASGVEPITYQWFKDDIVIAGANTPTLTVEGVTLEHNGFYYCDVTNDCGTTKSTVAQVIVTKDGGIQGVTDDNPISLRVTPNPAVSEIKISFSLENNSNVEIAILDMTGKKVASKLSEAQIGENTILWTLGNNIASGTYFVQVSYKGTSVTCQIVVKK